MKTLLFTLLTLAPTLFGFAQGKVMFANDSAHLFVVGYSVPPDVALGGGGINGSVGALPMSPFPSGVTIAASLYAGTSSTSLSLQSTIPLIGSNWLSPGRMTPKALVLNIPGGVPQFFTYVLHDAREVNPIAGPFFGPYWTQSGLFTAIPGTSITYPSLMPGGPANSTFPDGNLVLGWIPEPSAAVLLVLGLLVFRPFRLRSHFHRHESPTPPLRPAPGAVAGHSPG